jgi:hypothetical protein
VALLEICGRRRLSPLSSSASDRETPALWSPPMNRRWTESAAGPLLVGPAYVHARTRARETIWLPTESASQSRWRYRAKTTIYDVLVVSSAGGERRFTTERDAPLSDGDIQAERLSSSKPGAPA